MEDQENQIKEQRKNFKGRLRGFVQEVLSEKELSDVQVSLEDESEDRDNVGFTLALISPTRFFTIRINEDAVFESDLQLRADAIGYVDAFLQTKKMRRNDRPLGSE